ncbi:MAG: transposase [Polyangiales bacterium]
MNAIATETNALDYSTDLTDAEWAILSPLIPDPTWFPNLQEPQHTTRDMWNAIRYRTRTGCAWRLLPHEFPPWSTVYKCYQRWTRAGVLDDVHEALRHAVREHEGRSSEPTAAILDSQSVKSTDMGGPTGFDAGKKGQGTQTPSRRRRARAAARRRGDGSVGTGP